MKKQRVDGFKLYFCECPRCAKSNDDEPLGEDDFHPTSAAHEEFVAEFECECGEIFDVVVSQL